MSPTHMTTQALLLMQNLLNPVPTQPAASPTPPNPTNKSTSTVKSISITSMKLTTPKQSSSPLTLILDTLAQSSTPLLEHYIRHAKRSRARVIWVSFETLTTPVGVDLSVRAWEVSDATDDGDELSVERVRTRVVQALSGVDETRTQTTPHGTLVIIDSLHAIVAAVGAEAANYLSSFITQTSAVVAVVHADVPFSTEFLFPAQVHSHTMYAPPPLSLLRYLATTIMTVHSLAHVLARKAARNRSVVEPVFGLAGESEEREGVLVGLGSQDSRGFVVEMEHRRKSGRSVGGWYVFPTILPTSEREASVKGADSKANAVFSGVVLLEDHPLYHLSASTPHEQQSSVQEEMNVPFNLNLTDRQRADRKDVVLPYFDAQRDGGLAGPGKGGRILYDFGSEDDFDEEEDEI